MIKETRLGNSLINLPPKEEKHFHLYTLVVDLGAESIL